MTLGDLHFELTLRPVSGKAVPVLAGETLHLSLVEGPQCVDFNCFNLHDYKEHMSVGHMRMKGFRAGKGHIVWSRPPRYNPMMLISEIPDTCVTDLLGARCHAVPFEKALNYPGVHTNCQDILAECIGEYGLTPDDVHDSLNFWMNSGWDEVGNYIPNFERSTGKKGDSVTLLATMDVLVAVNTCGGGDFSITSNYWFNPVKVEIRNATQSTLQTVEQIRAEHTGFRTQRAPTQFRVSEIKSDRELRHDPHYVPNFAQCPIRIQSLSLPLDDRDWAALDKLVSIGLGDDPEDACRCGVMSRLDVSLMAREFDRSRAAK